MAFFSSPLPAQAPLPWGALRLPRTGWASGDRATPSTWGPPVGGGDYGIARSWVVSRRQPGEGPLGHAPTGWGG